ncbi:hypothetical protein JOF41_005899 [Saccharothrix coeruleofusca]|uniref:DUF3558 domain-containing protein n=1 Tax=Saccharothrix coeruleofusca TaxID=33919 RepID=UPI001AE1561C|nr:DUF3558 domain-containing protein [Saccharothrix coeruleofusca]MBP2339721.1 hypothetical protein [Saccharothrix coeruleofusca]
MAVVLMGCSSQESGRPTPERSASGSQSDVPTTGVGSDAPVRPGDVEIDDVDPCALLTAEQQAELKTVKVQNNPSEVVKGITSPSCSYRTASGVEPSYSYRVTLISGEGVDYWKAPGNLDVSPKEVSGFPALEVRLAGVSTAECSMAVDVADSRQLFVQFLPISRNFTRGQLCRNAVRGAELSLATLRALK